MDENETSGVSHAWWFAAPALALVLALLSARVRFEAAVEHTAFDRDRPESVLRSDPALLFHLTRRVVEDGATLQELAAEPNLAWPESVDAPASYTLGQEYLVRAARGVVGEELPLHVLTLGVMALVAALAGLGVYWIGLELTGDPRLGLLAAGIHALLPAAYRTLGFVLVREDLALPLFALHLALGLRAARTDRAWAWAAAGITLGLTLASWHAGGLLALASLGALALGALLTGRQPLASRRSLWGLGGFALVILATPALRAKGALWDLPMLLAAGLALAPWLGPRRARPALVIWVALALALRFFVLPSEDMGHVTRVLAAKLLFLGVLPDDPNVLSFEARMMWQGPFSTLRIGSAWHFFLLALLVLPLVLLHALTGGKPRPGERFLGGLLALGLILAWLAQRMVVLPALVLPALLALGARRAARDSQGPFGALGVASLLFLQAVLFAGWISDPPLPWYSEPRARETARLVDAVAERVPEGEAVAADFLLNPVLLATTGRPMVFQPKWEQRAARERVQALWTALYHGGPNELHSLLLERYRCRWFAVDRLTLGRMGDSLYLAGLPKASGPPPGSAALALCADDGRGVPGFDLVWESPPSGGAPGLYRLYRLSDDAPTR